MAEIEQNADVLQLFTAFVPWCVQHALAELSNSTAVDAAPPALRFLAAVLFADISGFTALTERLATKPNGAELLSDLADVTDAEFTESGIPLETGGWLRGHAQAARGGGSTGATEQVVAGIPEGVPKQDGGM